MQLCALNADDALVFAPKALKRTDYQCLECRQPVRLRHGIHRQPHFYHSQPNGACRLHAKGMPHVMLQYHLKELLPEGEVEIECRFPQIGRIADVAWHAKKIVYEIQYSPISPEEVLARNHSYASISYQVVWILHDKRYNQPLLSAAEDALRDSPHYYSNMNSAGQGSVYDQFAHVERGVRTRRLLPLPIDLSSPQFTEPVARDASGAKKLPFPLQQRSATWPLGFSGDTIDCWMQGDEKVVCGIQKLPKGSDNLSARYLFGCGISLYRRYLGSPYTALLRLFLERASR